MIWRTIKTYWKRISAVTLSVGAVLGVFWTASGYVIQADDWVDTAEAVHATTEENCIELAQAQTDIAQLAEIQRDILRQEQIKAQQEREKWRKVVELCLAGTISDKKVCAEAEAALK